MSQSGAQNGMAGPSTLSADAEEHASAEAQPPSSSSLSVDARYPVARPGASSADGSSSPSSTSTAPPSLSAPFPSLSPAVLSLPPPSSSSTSSSSPALPSPSLPSLLLGVSPSLKVIVHFRAAGDAPILKKSKFMLSASYRFIVLIDFLRKHLHYKPSDALFLFCSASFSPSPDALIFDLFTCFQLNNELVINYATQDAWG